MIQQPKLGKKIADLRKAKGFTQEELVEKCNLNVRTLQRIESGEVTPRPNTVKLIFEALELKDNHSFKSVEGNGEMNLKWLEQFYINIIDLFNLKTNTMKKISILSIIISVIVLGIFAVNTSSNAQKTSANEVANNDGNDAMDRDLVFKNYSCLGCTEKNGLLIGRDVSFNLNGVKVSGIRLFIMDKETREFDALFVKGKFLEKKVELEYSRDFLADGSLKYVADKIKKSDSKITMKGNVKITNINNKEDLNDDEIIEAEEITITFK